MPPTKTVDPSPHEVDPALQPIQRELGDALAVLKKMAEEPGKAVHASELRAARETLGEED